MSTRAPLPRFGAAIVLAGWLVLAGPAQVSAHAELLETTPAEGATVEGTPTEIVALFSEGLEADGSGLSLRDAAGDRVATGDVDPDDTERLVITDIPALEPGTYEARWTAKSDDGHLERGTWSFTVAEVPSPTPTVEPAASTSAPPSAAPSAVPSVTAAASASPAPTPEPDPTGSTGGDVVLPIIAGLAIVAIGGGLLLSRRGRTPAA